MPQVTTPSNIYGLSPAVPPGTVFDKNGSVVPLGRLNRLGRCGLAFARRFWGGTPPFVIVPDSLPRLAFRATRPRSAAFA